MEARDIVGVYGNDESDPFVDAVQRLVIFVAATRQLRFQYRYNLESNHGYDRRFSEGTVTRAGRGALALTRTTHREWGWEDWSREERFHASAAVERHELRFADRAFTYCGTRFTWREDVTAQTLSPFEDARAESERLRRRLRAR